MNAQKEMAKRLKPVWLSRDELKARVAEQEQTIRQLRVALGIAVVHGTNAEGEFLNRMHVADAVAITKALAIKV